MQEVSICSNAEAYATRLQNIPKIPIIFLDILHFDQALLNLGHSRAVMLSIHGQPILLTQQVSDVGP